LDYPSTILADHPVAYYRLEEPSGSATIADSSGNGFTGYVTYVTQADGTTVFPQLGVPGIDTHSALFATSTGVGQGHVDIPVNSTINPTLGDGVTGAPFSAELWVQATTQSSGYGVPLDDSGFFNTQNPNSSGWNFYQTAAGVGTPSTWSFSLRPNPGFVGNGPQVTLGQWTHLVLSYNGTTVTFYVNGVAANTYAVPQFIANDGSEDMLLGYGPATGQSPYAGYVDEVAVYNYALTATQVTNHYAIGTNSIVAPPTPPTFSLQPLSTNAYAGVPVTFSSQALGTTPLAYQWERVGSGAIANATNSSYTLTPAYPGDNGASFYVTVTNSAGSSNSATATLTVLTNLNVVYNPFSITRRVGSYAAFRVVANGAAPITYQWHSLANSVDQTIPGATSDTLWLSNIQASANGTLYYAQVSNPFGTAPSGQATLTVVPALNNLFLSTLYSQVVEADHPVAFWRLDEDSGTNAFDSVGSFDGAYSATPPDLTLGYPTGVPHDIDTGIHVTNTAIVTIPYALELNPVSGPWSYEFWIQPTSLDPLLFHTPISSEGNQQNLGTVLTGWNIYQYPGADVWTWNIYNGGGTGSFTSEFTDNPIVPGTWYYMVLTDDGTNMNWYSNGRLVLTESVSGVGFIQNGINGDPSVAGGPTTFAIRSDGVFGDWDGGMEDVAVYNYVLGPQQIQNHLLNTTHVTASKSPSNFTLTWPVGFLQSSLNVAGPYADVPGATSPYSPPLTGPHTFYRIRLAQ
jgi:hypothetical protein